MKSLVIKRQDHNYSYFCINFCNSNHHKYLFGVVVVDKKKLRESNQSKTREINVLKAERDFYRDLSQKYAELFELLLYKTDMITQIEM